MQISANVICWVYASNTTNTAAYAVDTKKNSRQKGLGSPSPGICFLQGLGARLSKGLLLSLQKLRPEFSFSLSLPCFLFDFCYYKQSSECRNQGVGLAPLTFQLPTCSLCELLVKCQYVPPREIRLCGAGKQQAGCCSFLLVCRRTQAHMFLGDLKLYCCC